LSKFIRFDSNLDPGVSRTGRSQVCSSPLAPGAFAKGVFRLAQTGHTPSLWTLPFSDWTDTPSKASLYVAPIDPFFDGSVWSAPSGAEIHEIFASPFFPLMFV